MDGKMICARGINKAYGRKKVLTDIAFEVERGQCAGFVGANGCGKSTFLALLAGALKPDSGEILYEGKKAREIVLPELVGYLPQGNPLIEELSVRDNLRLWYQAGRKSFERELREGIVPEMGLAEYLRVSAGKLSGGMKRRLSLACALVNRPKLLILDEPGAALDIVYKEEIRRYLKNYLAQGGTIVMTSHEEPELALCGRMWLMREGQLERIGTGYSGGQLAELMVNSKRGGDKVWRT